MVTGMNVNIPKLAALIEDTLHLGEEKSLLYANAIGDTPEFDKDRNIVIRDWMSNKIIDRVSIPMLEADYLTPG
jgi:hypothetical protein